MRFHAGHCMLPSGYARDVLIEIDAGRFTAVTAGVDAADAAGATRLPGVVLPGLANAHSHAFHRALRARVQHGTGGFWTWRDAMYAVAARLDPDSLLALATAAYAEMVLAGFTTVGEFHYLHHAPDGAAYADPNAMGEALREAARRAGIRLTLIDTAYLAGGIGPDGLVAPQGVQLRFADADIDAWAERVAAIVADDEMRVGVAAHSLRAVSERDLPAIVTEAAARPLHVHVCEQPDEVTAVRTLLGRGPIEVLADAGFWSPASTAVHATHVDGRDIALLADAGVTVCLAPTTERDLADGIAPAGAMVDAGVRLSLGTDQHAVIDAFEEMRAVELHERLVTHRRGRFGPADLIEAATRHDSLGWTDAGRIMPGARADLVAVVTQSVRTAGADPAQLVFAATAADIDTVIVGGETVVADGRHRLGDIAALLEQAIGPLWSEA